MLKVYKKLLFYVPKEKSLAYIAIGFTMVSTVVIVGAYYYLMDLVKLVLGSLI
ncbi:hypothetical protein ACR77J_15245 [Tissierella praeacuta]|uniref:hypothetical protein n=1 Tax=Tissierella praeacuta TaxID=43131 RepID=UPI003DA57769